MDVTPVQHVGTSVLEPIVGRVSESRCTLGAVTLFRGNKPAPVVETVSWPLLARRGMLVTASALNLSLFPISFKRK